MKQKESTRDWNDKKRMLWWGKNTLQILVWSVAIGTAMVAGGKWLYSRASDDDIKDIRKTKVDVEIHKQDVERIEKQVKEQGKFIGAIHINVVRLLEHSDVKAQEVSPDEEKK